MLGSMQPNCLVKLAESASAGGVEVAFHPFSFLDCSISKILSSSL